MQYIVSMPYLFLSLCPSSFLLLALCRLGIRRVADALNEPELFGLDHFDLRTESYGIVEHRGL